MRLSEKALASHACLLRDRRTVVSFSEREIQWNVSNFVCTVASLWYLLLAGLYANIRSQGTSRRKPLCSSISLLANFVSSTYSWRASSIFGIHGRQRCPNYHEIILDLSRGIWRIAEIRSMSFSSKSMHICIGKSTRNRRFSDVKDRNSSKSYFKMQSL